MQKLTIIMVKEKETKNTNRYAELPPEGAAPALNTLYMQKWPGGPTRIKVTIEEIP